MDTEDDDFNHEETLSINFMKIFGKKILKKDVDFFEAIKDFIKGHSISSWNHIWIWSDLNKKWGFNCDGEQTKLTINGAYELKSTEAEWDFHEINAKDWIVYEK